jgi:heme/copper-type cytochrome/quinol oxidase subunit 3
VTATSAEPVTRAGRTTGRPVGHWGTVAMIVTEATMFALLLFSYGQLRAQADRWPLGDTAEPELLTSALRTVVLLGSTIPMHMADKAAERRDGTTLRWGLATGALMGAVFLVGHFHEWTRIWSELRPTTDAYGSLFYTITGLHALHLVVGLVIVGFLLVGAFNGRYDDAPTHPVKNGVLYWHFVDAVWVVVYGVLYLSVSLA